MDVTAAPSHHNSGHDQINLANILKRARNNQDGVRYLENGGVEVIPSINGESIKVQSNSPCAFDPNHIQQA